MTALRMTLAALLTIGPPGPGAAAGEAPVPSCHAARAGAVACLSETLCVCRHDYGGSITGRPAGYRWDCGALRPSCGMVPPTGGGLGGMPGWSMQDLPPLMLAPGHPGRTPQEPWVR